MALFVDLDTNQLYYGTQCVSLRPHRARILFMLVEKIGRGVRQSELFDSLYGDKLEPPDPGTLTTHISMLRKDLADANIPARIQTIYGTSYRLVMDTTDETAEFIARCLRYRPALENFMRRQGHERWQLSAEQRSEVLAWINALVTQRNALGKWQHRRVEGMRQRRLITYLLSHNKPVSTSDLCQHVLGDDERHDYLRKIVDRVRVQLRGSGYTVNSYGRGAHAQGYMLRSE